MINNFANTSLVDEDTIELPPYELVNVVDSCLGSDAPRPYLVAHYTVWEVYVCSRWALATDGDQ